MFSSMVLPTGAAFPQQWAAGEGRASKLAATADAAQFPAPSTAAIEGGGAPQAAYRYSGGPPPPHFYHHHPPPNYGPMQGAYSPGPYGGYPQAPGEDHSHHPGARGGFSGGGGGGGGAGGGDESSGAPPYAEGAAMVATAGAYPPGAYGGPPQYYGAPGGVYPGYGGGPPGGYPGYGGEPHYRGGYYGGGGGYGPPQRGGGYEGGGGGHRGGYGGGEPYGYGGGHTHHPRQALNLPIDLANIENGSDTRSTIMVRHIPSRYTQQQLIADLVETGFHGACDYVYLPVDFRNGCRCVLRRGGAGGPQRKAF
jgi:hypothetical protein